MTRSAENTILYIVVPCYNEESLLPDTSAALSQKLDLLIAQDSVNTKSKILFVDDGSTDESWEIIKKLCQNNKRILGLSLARNRGHQNALYAGLMYAKEAADAVITIDADLQQDMEAIDRFLAEYLRGSEIVYGIRNNRNTDSTSKRFSAGAYYSIMHAFGVNILRDAADYRLLSQKALSALSEYRESNLFLRGIISDIGLKSSIVKFDVFPRTSGNSKYTLRKMVKLAINGITSFTMRPLHIIAILGIGCVLLSIVMIIYVLVDWLLKNTVPGYATILISIWLVGGLNLFALGVVGEYIGHAYIETKRRPKYCIEDICMDNRDVE